MWADNSDSEGESSSRPSFGGGRKDYSAPVNFVSAGVQNQKKDKVANAKEVVKEDSDASSDEDSGGGRRGFGGGGGLGFRSQKAGEY